MVSETNKNSQDQALEERLSNMHEQMAGVTSRLDQTERALDLERATREDIIKAEVIGAPDKPCGEDARMLTQNCR